MTMMRIAEVAKRTGVPAATLRYYEDIGLLAPAGRSENGYREYADRDLERLAFISRAKSLDIRLHELRDLVDVWDTADCSHVQHRMAAVVNARVAETQARIVDLVALAGQLQSAAAMLSSAQASDGECGPDCACMDESDSAVESLPFPTMQAAAATPVACTLPSKFAEARMSDWQAVILRASNRETRVAGVTLTFPHDAALISEIARLATAEVSCCSFLRFDVAIDVVGVRLQVAAPAGAREFITDLFGSAA